ncbi:NADPH-dependent oxidoreductase [Pigmentiphaga litoralis]|uniref:NADPH-dependent oxidoreductase n=1 Tax=Pigmentiphaga litoralis TaxID=516702 RepID=UPI003B435160
MNSVPQTTLTQMLAARYGAAAAGADDLNDTLATLLGHRSVRTYTDAPVPDGTLELLVAAAQSASSSSNLQAWSVVAVTDPARKQRLAHLVGDQKHVEECPLFLVWIADLARLRSLGLRRGMPHASLDHLEMFLVATIDAALASQNAAVAAESLGLGVVYIGGIRDRPEEVAAELNLPSNTFGVFGMCIGYPDATRPAAVKPRLPQTAVLFREQYDATTLEPAADSYNAVMAQFYQSQGMKPKGEWDQHSLQRVRGPEAMKGRDRLVEVLNRMGFALK